MHMYMGGEKYKNTGKKTQNNQLIPNILLTFYYKQVGFSVDKLLWVICEEYIEPELVACVSGIAWYYTRGPSCEESGGQSTRLVLSRQSGHGQGISSTLCAGQIFTK